MSRIISYEDQKEILINNAIEMFGTTEYPEEAGFILEDGRYLDFSQGQRFERPMDHRSIEGAFKGRYENFIPDYDEYRTSRGSVLSHFQKVTGAIRLMYYDDGVGIDAEVPISNIQIDIISRLVRKNRHKFKWIQVLMPELDNNHQFFDIYELNSAIKLLTRNYKVFDESDELTDILSKIENNNLMSIKKELEEDLDVQVYNINKDDSEQTFYILDFSNSYWKFDFKNNREYSGHVKPEILVIDVEIKEVSIKLKSLEWIFDETVKKRGTKSK